ncbi:MAG: hypothetical protein POG24_11805, partial [Acidocella sp.]|nr:hypothetical protein [Acidocella sp.]
MFKLSPGSRCFLLGSALTVLASAPALAGGQFTVLYSFTGGADGGYPAGPVTLDAAGNIYGQTSAGGTGCPLYSSNGCGTVYKIDPSGNETTLVEF